ncbi:hypothetical protein RFI_07653 [Reticulomyxa filosa]|uniref:Uncharacterized protein n=1 Tax=Reticulomyxa filosa TaxID=46433 RepID=X6NU68_RETFI|nr:hypothetical protein RFI_07653 [Reticulomyxa filosa]|eukprot:ETO29468.1 hypothetical protein RFI_07653 [Reticulomyxa filosa]
MTKHTLLMGGLRESNGRDDRAVDVAILPDEEMDGDATGLNSDIESVVNRATQGANADSKSSDTFGQNATNGNDTGNKKNRNAKELKKSNGVPGIWDWKHVANNMLEPVQIFLQNNALIWFLIGIPTAIASNKVVAVRALSAAVASATPMLLQRLVFVIFLGRRAIWEGNELRFIEEEKKKTCDHRKSNNFIFAKIDNHINIKEEKSKETITTDLTNWLELLDKSNALCCIGLVVNTGLNSKAERKKGKQSLCQVIFKITIGIQKFDFFYNDNNHLGNTFKKNRKKQAINTIESKIYHFHNFFFVIEQMNIF